MLHGCTNLIYGSICVKGVYIVVSLIKYVQLACMCGLIYLCDQHVLHW